MRPERLIKDLEDLAIKLGLQGLSVPSCLSDAEGRAWLHKTKTLDRTGRLDNLSLISAALSCSSSLRAEKQQLSRLLVGTAQSILDGLCESIRLRRNFSVRKYSTYMLGKTAILDVWMVPPAGRTVDSMLSGLRGLSAKEFDRALSSRTVTRYGKSKSLLVPLRLIRREMTTYSLYASDYPIPMRVELVRASDGICLRCSFFSTCPIPNKIFCSALRVTK